MHGRGGSQCGLWWIARDLAGHGYIALVLTHDGNLSGHVRAARSAVRWLRSTANPYRRLTDRTRIGLAGHSQGSNAIQLVQQDEAGVRAIVALDSLKRYANGDPAAAVGCRGTRSPIKPRVPALGFAMDFPCAQRPTKLDPELKKTGHRNWKAARLPTMTLVMRGYDHSDFTARGSPKQLRRVHHFVIAWFDRYLLGLRAATRRLLATEVYGQPTEDLLSRRFRSAVALPRALNCEDYRLCLRQR